MSKTSKYDAFLSYSSKDKETVHTLAEQLNEDGLRMWMDASVIPLNDSITRVDVYGK